MSNKIESILVTSELSDRSDSVVTAAKQLAEQTGAKLVALHVLTEDALEGLREELPTESSYIDRVTDLLRSQLRDQMAMEDPFHPAPVFIVVEGDPGEMINRVAERENVDVIVLGVRHRSRVGKALLGSTSQEVLLSAPCLVLSVPVPRSHQ